MLWKDLSWLESSKGREVSNVRHWQTLERKYSIRVKTLSVVTEELKQRLDIASNVRRYQERVDRFGQNTMFQNNQRQLYWEWNQKGEIWEDEQSDVEESKKL